jgi:3-isopropylmalate/(R)-2-methylmalate dehydratase small subunit
MKPLTTISGSMVALRRANVDTDQIMPKQFLKRVERTGYGEFLFHDWRRTEPDFILNRPESRIARILLTGPNFGGGSSREHAPWGLQDWGFEAIVSASFGDIFRNNCTKIGLLPVTLPEEEVNRLMDLAESNPAAIATIDLAAQTLVAGDGFAFSFELDQYTKWRLLNGLDDIGLTMRHVGAIAAYEAGRPAHRPSLTAHRL